VSNYLFKVRKTCLFTVNKKEREFILNYFHKNTEDELYWTDEKALKEIEEQAKKEGNKVPQKLMNKLRKEIQKDNLKELSFILGNFS